MRPGCHILLYKTRCQLHKTQCTTFHFCRSVCNGDVGYFGPASSSVGHVRPQNLTSVVTSETSRLGASCRGVSRAPTHPDMQRGTDAGSGDSPPAIM